MATPDGLFTLIREVLSEKIAPGPKQGEGWCVRCSHNEGRTLVMPADQTLQHAESHRNDNPMGYVKILFTEKKKNTGVYERPSQ